MKAVATELAVLVLCLLLSGCAMSTAGREHSQGEESQTQFDIDLRECRRYAMIDALLAPTGHQAPSKGQHSEPGNATGKDSSESVTHRCMAARGHSLPQ
jgi:PBP1b-binding outer membrane lipoprotein LpoB